MRVSPADFSNVFSPFFHAQTVRICKTSSCKPLIVTNTCLENCKKVPEKIYLALRSFLQQVSHVIYVVMSCLAY